MKKKIAILGSTSSIGRSLLSIIIKDQKSKSIFLRKKPVWVFIKNKLLSISSSEIRRVHNLNKTEFQI